MGHVFELDTLQQIARRGIGKPFDEMTREVVEGLLAAYPDHIDPANDYIFNLTTGFCGMMKVLHASVTEYLIIFGSAVGTEAYSGRYQLEIHDFVMTGEMWAYTEESCGVRAVTRPGEHAVLQRSKAKGWRILEGTWMLEYGRGFLPSALPLVLGDVLLSAMDLRLLARTLAIHGRLTLRELLRGKL